MSSRKTPEIILATNASPRHEALREAGIRFTVELPEISVKWITNTTYFRPGLIAEAKLQAIRNKLKSRRDGIIIAVDTVIFYGKVLRDRPENHTQLLKWAVEYGASRMVIEVVTAMTAFNLWNGEKAADKEISRIFLNSYSEEDAKRIADCDEFLKAPGGILPRHELWKERIDRIEGGGPGSPDGMPLDLLEDLIRQVS